MEFFQHLIHQLVNTSNEAHRVTGRTLGVRAASSGAGSLSTMHQVSLLFGPSSSQTIYRTEGQGQNHGFANQNIQALVMCAMQAKQNKTKTKNMIVRIKCKLHESETGDI